MIGKAWSSDEYIQLLSELKDKKSLKEMAEAHGRTENAIKFKIVFYACNKVLVEGQSQESVLEETGLTAEQLQEGLDKRKPNPVPLTVLSDDSVKPVAKPVAKPSLLANPVVVKKSQNHDMNKLRDILAVVNSAQKLLTTYIKAHE